MSLNLGGRPGSDPLRPHQDLRIPSRIPSQYLSHILPYVSSSASNASPSAAVQVASLHRAAEVARFEWRTSQRSRQSSPCPLSRGGAAESATARTQEARQRSTHSSRTPLPQINDGSSQVSSLHAAQAQDSRASRVFASASEAYDSAVQDLHRHTGIGLLDLSDNDGTHDVEDDGTSSETSTDSNHTETMVMRATLTSAASPRRTGSVNGGFGAFHQSTIHRDRARLPTSALVGLSGDHSLLAEGQVWDRMVNDLAVTAGISSGTAASIMALPATASRSEVQWNTSSSSSSTANTAPLRILPHPIWARRYPGSAGEWLRGELARRANGTMAQSHTTQSPSSSIRRPAPHALRRRSSTVIHRETDADGGPFPTTIIHDDVEHAAERGSYFNGPLPDRNRRPSTWDWNILRFPSLDPSSREERRGEDATSRAEVQGDDSTTSVTLSSSNSLTIPIDSRAHGPTPPLPEITHQQRLASSRQSQAADANGDSQQSDLMSSNNDHPQQSNNVNSDAANLVARMAQASRDLAASRATSHAAPTLATDGSGPNRAARGGMSYIHRLRLLDGLESTSDFRGSVSLNSQEQEDEEPCSPVRSYELFPWYHPPMPSSSRPLVCQEDSDDAQFDPNGSSLDWFNLARQRMASQLASEAQNANDDPDGERVDEDEQPSRHSLGVRRRVIADTGTVTSQRARNRSALVMADAAQNTSTAQLNDAMDAWTLVDQRPMSPVRQNQDEGSENVTSWLREPAHPTGRFSTSPLPMVDSEQISNGPVVTRRVNTYRPLPATDDPRMTRRPRRLASLTDSDTQPYAFFNTFDGAEGRSWRENTPSPELIPADVSSAHQRRSAMEREQSVLGRARQLSSIGRRLEEEFQARQGELRQREERLRQEVARRRLELDQVRRRQGRIGRVLDRSREGNGATLLDPSSEAAEAETVPLLGEHETSLIRRHALREPRRQAVESIGSLRSAEQDYPPQTFREPAPTPLQEILARISLNSHRMHSSAEDRNLRRTNSWSASEGQTAQQDTRLTSLDDFLAVHR